MKEKQERQIKIIVVSIIIFLCVATVFIFYPKIKDSDEPFIYNGFSVYKIETENDISYKIKLFIENNPQPFLITTRNDPKELEEIPVEENLENLKEKIIKKELYITMSPNLTAVTVIAATEISKITGNGYLFNLPTHGALTKDVGTNAPIKTCKDVNATTSIILLKLGGEIKIYPENDCVIIEAPNEYDLIKAADRLSLTLLGIMK